MAADSGQISAGLRKLYRQDAVVERVDFPDGPVVSTRSTPRPQKYLNTKSVHESKLVNPVTTASHEHTHNLQSSPAKCDSPSLQPHPPSSTKYDGRRSKKLLAKYSDELASYQLLLMEGNRETVFYDWASESRTVDKSKQPAKRRDFSDGLPVSPPAFPATRKQDVHLRNVYSHKDFSDVFPQPTSERQDQRKISAKKSNNSCSSDDEGFNNDSLTLQNSFSFKSPLADIQEKKALDYDSHVPEIMLNDGSMNNSFSESGKQKGEGFRQSKKSSGYGSGGSREAGSTETEYSSVFTSTENATDKDAIHQQQLFAVRTFSTEDLELNTGGLPRQSSGERQGELKDTSLPPEARVWRLSPKIIIPQHIMDNCNNIKDITDKRVPEVLAELIKANPKKLHNLLKQDAKHQLETTEEDLRNMHGCDFGCLSSASWANSEHASTEGYTTSEEIELLISEESAPSNLGNSSHEFNPVPTASDKEVRSSDEIDGKKCVSQVQTLPSGYTSKGRLSNGYQSPSHSANGYESPSNSHLHNGYGLPRDTHTGYGSQRDSHTGYGSQRDSPIGNGTGSSTNPLHNNGYISASQLTKNHLYLSSQVQVDAPEDILSSQHGDVKTELAGQKPKQLRARGLPSANYKKESSTERECRSKDSSRFNTETPGGASQVPRSHASSYLYRDGSHINGPTAHRVLFCIERFSFCQNNPCDDLQCLQGKRLVLALQDAFQSDRITDQRNILKLVWRHSVTCQELECRVAFCDVFRKRPDCSFEEHLTVFSSGSLSQRLQTDIARLVMKEVPSGQFLMLSSSCVISHTLWKTARVRRTQPIGRFGDFNILYGTVSVERQDDSKVVFKKARCHKGTHDVYSRVNRKSSSYIVESYWCSQIMEGTLLICSAYQNLHSLHTFVMHPHFPMHLSVCLKLIQQVLQAVQFLQSEELEVAYLNWKCSSILWDGQTNGANIKLCNFSQAIRVPRGCITKCPVDFRSSYDPRFTAPEVFCDECLNVSSDIWGIGCLLYEMLEKRPPYPDHAHESPARIRELVQCNRIEHTYPDVENIGNSGLLQVFSDCWERCGEIRCRVDMLQKNVATLLLTFDFKNMAFQEAEMNR